MSKNFVLLIFNDLGLNEQLNQSLKLNLTI